MLGRKWFDEWRAHVKDDDSVRGSLVMHLLAEVIWSIHTLFSGDRCCCTVSCWLRYLRTAHVSEFMPFALFWTVSYVWLFAVCVRLILLSHFVQLFVSFRPSTRSAVSRFTYVLLAPVDLIRSACLTVVESNEERWSSAEPCLGILQNCK